MITTARPSRSAAARPGPAAVRHPKPGAAPSWSFLTNYALILVYVALHPDSTVRTIASDIGITERAALAILRDLDDEGIVDRAREGRRNVYSVNFGRLSAVRRGGSASPRTPRPFVDGVLKMLYEIAKERGAVHRPPRPIAEHEAEARQGTWAFFTNHMLILLALARDGNRTVRELAGEVDITERAAVAILNQLEDAGIIRRHREGRRNRYTIDFAAFEDFRGWTFPTWRIPEQLIAAAIEAIRGLTASRR
jgi:DNA-binding MarR family transcriptional regulator